MGGHSQTLCEKNAIVSLQSQINYVVSGGSDKAKTSTADRLDSLHRRSLDLLIDQSENLSASVCMVTGYVHEYCTCNITLSKCNLPNTACITHRVSNMLSSSQII